MSSFTNDLLVRIEQGEWQGRGTFTVMQEFTYEIGFLGSGDKITVPVGFVSDGCSIPAFGRMFLPVLGKAAKAGVLHDYLLSTHYGKIKSAEVFNEAMQVLEVPKVRRLIMYWAVKYYPWAKKVEKK